MHQIHVSKPSSEAASQRAGTPSLRRRIRSAQRADPSRNCASRRAFWSSVRGAATTVIMPLVALLLSGDVGVAAVSAELRSAVESCVNREYASLFELYQHLHAHPELSRYEEKTAARVAEELK